MINRDSLDKVIRTLNMAFRVTEAEKQQIEARRKRTGLNIRQYLLQSALGGKVYVVAELKPLLVELKAYGRNAATLIKTTHRQETFDICVS